VSATPDPDEQATNRLDPLVPRPIDLPTRLGPGGRIDPEVGDVAKILAAPDDPADWPRWREDLAAWRDEARERIGYRGDRYDDPATAWAATAYAVAQIWLWDERLFDRGAGRFTPERLLDWYAPYGGLDGLVLWHAYPVIGIDDRNQFDFYRAVPGIRELVARFHELGVRVFVDYNPWDVGTRRADRADPEELVALVEELGTDGVFLDTLKSADSALIGALLGATPPQVLEGESRVPLDRVADHRLSWAQWFADSAAPGVLRAHWFERRHMMHHTRRWNRDHSAELQSSWVNGTGMLVWDAVFGVWVGWSDRDRDTLARMLAVQRGLSDVLIEGEWEPLVELHPEAVAAGVHASRFALDGVELFALVNRGAEDYTGPVLPDGAREAVPGRGIAALVRIAEGVPADRRAEVEAVVARERALPRSRDARFPARPAERVVPARSRAEPPADAVRPAPGPRRIEQRWRRRETGRYQGAPYVEEWKPLPPRLHDEQSETVEVDLAAVAVAAREVSAAEYAAFAAATGRSAPEAAADDAPATGIDLADARAYAVWAGARLPTELEWQAAAAEPGFARRVPEAWNWTESEHSDGITRFVMLTGGSAHETVGSDWYFDGGVREPAWTAKYLLLGLGMDRSPSIGFRLAWDLP